MDVLTTTPFGSRPVTAALLQRAAAARRAPALPQADKWELFHDLCAARAAFGLRTRHLAVLNALLSFHPGRTLSDDGNLIVFPSNATLCERAHGMAESTLRRNLAALVASGLIARHDSPNGKRYAARDANGDIARAFGFDLRPLLQAAPDILAAAEEARAIEQRIKRAREAVMLLKRDALKLSEYGQQTAPDRPWGAIRDALLDTHRMSRRKLDEEELDQLGITLRHLLSVIRGMLPETEKTGGCDSRNERHYSNSDKDTSDLESAETGQSDKTSDRLEPGRAGTSADGKTPILPLGLVLKACPDILPYSPDPVRHWHQLVALAGLVRGMMGISPSAWEEAQQVMGREAASATVAAILQRVDEIRTPGGYLRALTAKARGGGFSPAPMILALLQPDGRA